MFGKLFLRTSLTISVLFTYLSIIFITLISTTVCVTTVHAFYDRNRLTNTTATATTTAVTCRGLVLLARSGSWRERDIIISFRGDLDSTGSCSQIVRLFSTV